MNGFAILRGTRYVPAAALPGCIRSGTDGEGARIP